MLRFVVLQLSALTAAVGHTDESVLLQTKSMVFEHSDKKVDSWEWPQPREGLNDTFREYWHQRDSADVAALLRLCQGEDERVDTILLGDSISELWRRPSFSRHAKRPLAYQEDEMLPADFNFEVAFGPRATVAAIGGDTVADLGWRLQHELGEALLTCVPRRVHLLIGTNDLGHDNEAAVTVDDIFSGYRRLVDDLLELLWGSATPVSLVLQTLMPRAAFANPATCHCGGAVAQAEHYPKEMVWGPCEQATEATPIPSDGRAECSEFFPMVSSFNERIRETAVELRGQGHNVEVLDCNSFFLDAEGRLSKDMFGDLLHPTVEGYRRWGECVRGGESRDHL